MRKITEGSYYFQGTGMAHASVEISSASLESRNLNKLPGYLKERGIFVHTPQNHHPRREELTEERVSRRDLTRSGVVYSFPLEMPHHPSFTLFACTMRGTYKGRELEVLLRDNSQLPVAEKDANVDQPDQGIYASIIVRASYEGAKQTIQVLEEALREYYAPKDTSKGKTPRKKKER